MAKVLVTGMSGTGKSSALAELGRHGFRVVDTDSPGWSEWIPPTDGAEGEWLWREERIAELLASEDERTLYVQGCVSNQGKFYDRFDAVVLLSAPTDTLPPRLGGAAAAGAVHPRDRCEQAARGRRRRADRDRWEHGS